MSDLKFEAIIGGVKASGTDPNVSMDDLADVLFEGFLRSEAKLRESGQSHFNMPEGDKLIGCREPLLRAPPDGHDPGEADRADQTAPPGASHRLP